MGTMSVKNLDDILGAAVESGAVPGVVALVADRTAVTYEAAFGKLEINGGTDATVDAVFWIGSQTKAITSAAALQLVEQGKWDLDEPVADLLPEIAAPEVLDGFDAAGEPVLRPARTAITLRHLLTHTAGFTYDVFCPDMSRFHELRDIPNIVACDRRTLTTPLISEPGERWMYGIGTDWVGQLVERLAGQPLDAYLSTHIFEPLDMADTSFRLSASQRARLASMHARGAEGELAVIPFEVPQEPGFLMGGGGLYSTGRDYQRFQQMILQEGRAPDGTPVLQPDTVAMMAANQIGDRSVTRLESGIPAFTNVAEFFPGVPKKWSLAFMINELEAPPGAARAAWGGPVSVTRTTGSTRRVTSPESC